jgi:hypothetical protein
MSMNGMQTTGNVSRLISNRHRSWRQATVAACLLLATVTAVADSETDNDEDVRGTGYCSATATLLFQSCAAETVDDSYKAKAICINVSDAAQRKTCLADAKTARRDARKLCRDQLAGRRGACQSLGEARYDPVIDPSQFDNNFSRLPNPNRYFPLKIGNKWEYGGEGENISIEILNRTKLIAGLTCVVFRDQVFIDGKLSEDTDDWFAQAKNGDVYYCGEEVKDYDSFDGDKPSKPELVKIDGTFKWGRDGDKGGVFFRAAPKQGDVYREEFSARNAEDVAQVLSTTYQFGVDPELDRFVPQQLASLLCHGDCVVTKNINLNEPGALARKYYAPGLGNILEVNLNTGKIVQLVSCNFDSRCGQLPKP